MKSSTLFLRGETSRSYMSKDVLKTTNRTACADCGSKTGIVTKSGPHWKVNCDECGRYLYFASRWEIEGKMPRKELSNKPGNGVLFGRQGATGNQPNYEGGVNIDGVEYTLSGWKKTSKAGKAYLSLRVRRADDQMWRQGSANGQSQEDDIPF